MPRIPLFNKGSQAAPARIPPHDVRQFGQTSAALVGLGQQISGLGKELVRIKKEEEEQEALVSAAEIGSGFSIGMDQIIADELKLPFKERDAFRVKAMEDLEKETQKLAGEQGDRVTQYVERTMSRGKAEFYGAAIKRDADFGLSERKGRFNTVYDKMVNQAIKGSEELFNVKLKELGALVTEGVERTLLTPEEGEKKLRDTTRKIRIERHRQAMAVQPLKARKAIAVDPKLKEEDRRQLMQEALNKADEHIRRDNEAFNQSKRDREERARVMDDKVTGMMLKDPTAAIRVLNDPQTVRTLGAARHQRAMERARQYQTIGDGPLVSTEGVYFGYKELISDSTTRPEFENIRHYLMSDPELTRGDKGKLMNELEQGLGTADNRKISIKKSKRSDARAWIKGIFTVTGTAATFRPRQAAIANMTAEFRQRLDKDPSLDPWEVAREVVKKGFKGIMAEGKKSDKRSFKMLMKSVGYPTRADMVTAWGRGEVSDEEKARLDFIWDLAEDGGFAHPSNIIDEKPKTTPKKKDLKPTFKG